MTQVLYLDANLDNADWPKRTDDHWDADSPPSRIGSKVFCPTGPGGGVDATCSPGKAGNSQLKDYAASAEKVITSKSGNAGYADHQEKEMNSFLKSPAAKELWKKRGQGNFDIDSLPPMERGEAGLLRPAGEFKDKSDGGKLAKLLEIRAADAVASKLEGKLTKEDVEQFAADNPGLASNDHFGVAKKIVDSWNWDCTGLASVALQTQVQAKFGIEGASRPKWKEHRWGGEEGLQQHLGTGANKKVYDAAVDAIYETTQEKLKEAGIDSLVVYRGKPDSSEDASGYLLSKRIDTVQSNPLSSYSTSISQAEVFTRGDGSSFGTVLGTVVPSSRIFSHPAAGIGTTMEAEVVVMHDSKAQVKVASFKHKRYLDDNDNYEYDNTEIKDKFWSLE